MRRISRSASSYVFQPPHILRQFSRAPAVGGVARRFRRARRAEAHDALRISRHVGLVRHHDHRDVLLEVQPRQQLSMISRPRCESRLPVGCRRKQHLGLVTSARAIAIAAAGRSRVRPAWCSPNMQATAASAARACEARRGLLAAVEQRQFDFLLRQQVRWYRHFTAMMPPRNRWSPLVGTSRQPSVFITRRLARPLRAELRRRSRRTSMSRSTPPGAWKAAWPQP